MKLSKFLKYNSKFKKLVISALWLYIFCILVTPLIENNISVSINSIYRTETVRHIQKNIFIPQKCNIILRIKQEAYGTIII